VQRALEEVQQNLGIFVAVHGIKVERRSQRVHKKCFALNEVLRLYECLLSLCRMAPIGLCEGG
jgi:hypothetical protein